MTTPGRTPRSLRTVAAIGAVGVLLSGCALVSSPAHEEATAAQQKAASERRAVEEATRRQAASQRELEERAARQHLQLLEKDAEIKGLNQKLEAAILEVVRAMAKLRGLSGRAEAASNLAETEIALKSLPTEPALRPKDTDLQQAQQLLKLATEGTVYLATQVKMLIRPRSERPVRGAEAGRTEGEQPLSPELALRAANKTNVREGPGPAFKVLFVVDRGTALNAVSYSGVWVRVKTDDGRGGWVHHTLVDQR
jgi:hypothetical protein